MKVDIQARGFPLTEALAQAIDHQIANVRQALADRLTALQVRLSDANADRGGIDKCCMVSVTASGGLRYVANGIDADMYRAIAAAFDRLRRAAQDDTRRRRRWRSAAARSTPRDREGH